MRHQLRWGEPHPENNCSLIIGWMGSSIYRDFPVDAGEIASITGQFWNVANALDKLDTQAVPTPEDHNLLQNFLARGWVTWPCAQSNSATAPLSETSRMMYSPPHVPGAMAVVSGAAWAPA